ncbi:glycosyltransferase [Zoogloea sp.]|uniref:glycosyltransferase n=1 Tax=Zoogloea sp. TaxID=49181 RepID=UPI0035B00A3F
MAVCTPRVVAVVVTHSRPEELRLVVDALLGQSLPLTRILVVDNASPIPANQVLGTHPRVEIVRSDINTGGAGGFAFALETAARHAWDWVWMLDDDAVPAQTALAELLRQAPALPADAGALCSAVYEFSALATMHRRSFSANTGRESPLPNERYQAPFCQIDTGSFVGFLLARQAFERAGLPDARFFLAYDDTEYSLRLKKLGFNLWLIPASHINHLRLPGAKLRGSPFGPKHYYNIRNRIHVMRTYTRMPRLAGTKAILVGLALLLLAQESFTPRALRLFIKSVQDGLQGRLGTIK